MSFQTPLGIIAGEGQFPFLVAQGAKYKGRETVAIGFKEHTNLGLHPLVKDMLWLRLGQLGKMLSYFKKHGVQEVVFAGGIHKPKALKIRPDLKAAKLLFQTRNKNDNTLMSAIVNLFQKEGITVISPFEFVPNLKTPVGILSKRKPSKQEEMDIDFGWPIAKEIGRLDIGQSIVVKEQMVVAVEAMEGTNETIKRAGKLVDQGFMVIKVFKPGQEQFIDQPAVGLKTIETMIKAGGTCLVVEAGNSLFFDREQALHLADKSEICIIGQ